MGSTPGSKAGRPMSIPAAISASTYSVVLISKGNRGITERMPARSNAISGPVLTMTRLPAAKLNLARQLLVRKVDHRYADPRKRQQEFDAAHAAHLGRLAG